VMIVGIEGEWQYSDRYCGAHHCGNVDGSGTTLRYHVCHGFHLHFLESSSHAARVMPKDYAYIDTQNVSVRVTTYVQKEWQASTQELVQVVGETMGMHA